MLDICYLEFEQLETDIKDDNFRGVKYLDTGEFEDEYSHNHIEENREQFIAMANEYFIKNKLSYIMREVCNSAMVCDKKSRKILYAKIKRMSNEEKLKFTEVIDMNNLLKEIQVEMKKIDDMKKDYKKKNELCGESSFNDGAINAIENTEDKIKRAIARAVFPEKVEELQKWIGVLCEAYRCDNSVTWNAIAEQVVYEMFKENIK